jgi:membrane glycosyltransferase
MEPTPAAQTPGPACTLDGTMARPTLSKSYLFRRRLIFGLTVTATTLFLGGWFATLLSGRFGILEFALLALFTLYIPCLAIAFWNGALGFALLNWTKRGLAGGWAPFTEDGAITAPTVIAMALRNEPPARAFAQLKVLASSLDRIGCLNHFDFFILSDSDRSDVIAAEEAEFEAFRAEGGSTTRRFYRRRTDCAGFKSGNIHDFCDKAGRKYDLLVLLDSDSLMTGQTVMRLVRYMQSNPSLGILQTFSLGLPSRSLFARIFLFGHRQSMRCAMAGAAWWQGDCGHYWGHNCIVRMKPFIEHCQVFLPGGPLAGHNVNWSSHDQIEAALMRRAGYAVRFLPEEGGSYEDNPPAFPEYLRRYRRWSLGSMQNLQLLGIPGLLPMSRFHLCLLAARYGGAAGTFAFVLIAALDMASPQSDSSFPIISAATLYATWTLLYFSPKLFGVADALIRSRKQFGGAFRLILGCLVEFVFTLLLAPLSMFTAFVALAALLLRRPQIWNGQQRDGYRLAWRSSLLEFWPQTLLGLALVIFLAVAAPHALPWFLPFAVGLVLAVPFAVATASRSLGDWAATHQLCATPEEIEPPDEVAAIRPDLAAAR